MKQRIMLLSLALLLLLAGCQSNSNNSDSGPSEPDIDIPEGPDIQHDRAFAVEPIADGTTYTLSYVEGTNAEPVFEMDVIPGATCSFIGGDQWDNTYYVAHPDGASGMSVVLHACRRDPMAYFGVSSDAELADKLLAYIFSTEDRYQGQLRAVSDFQYELTLDHRGQKEGWEAYLIEFEVEEDGVYAIRYFTGNDAINADYAAIEVRIDMPMDDHTAYEDYLRMIHSIRKVA